MWSGILIGIGLIAILNKLSTNAKLFLTTFHVSVDVVMLLLLFTMHGRGDSHSGSAAAAIASLVIGIYLSWLRRHIGYWNKDEYVPGTHNVEDQIK
jgi:hypothetical protein